MELPAELNVMEPMYYSYSEKELVKMWDDINGKNFESLNKNLMKAIEKEENKSHIEELKEIMYSKQMWDSEKGAWIPFDLWGAHFIINQRKEYVLLRIYRPCDVQPEFGPTIKGWHTLDSSYLNDQLKEGKTPEEKYSPYKSFSGRQSFYEMIKQDKQEYIDEGRIDESLNNSIGRKINV